MTLRKLEPEEKVVFDLIVKQHAQCGRYDGCFVYDVRQCQEELMRSGKASEYGIGYEDHNKIIQKLAEDGIIKADWIVGYDPYISFDDTESYGEFEFKYSGDGKEIQKQHAQFFYDHYAINDVADYEGMYFIQLEPAWIKKVNDANTTEYTCSLVFDSEKGHFVVRCKDEELIIKKLKIDLRPSEILKHAIRKPQKTITRDDLNKTCDTKLYVGKASLSTQVFCPRSVVNNELKPFVKLTSDSICVTPTAKLTPLQLEELKKVCF